MSSKIRTPQQLAKVLQGYRKQLGMTQKQTADKVGLLAKTVSALENDPDGVTILSLFKLLSALDLEVVLQPKVAAKTSKGEW
jgi:HTH-type transcriptional regulator/antitoxin HipB